MRVLGVSVLIGAMLSGGFRSAIGQAAQGLGGINRAARDLQGTLIDVGQAVAGAYALGTQVRAAGNLEHQLSRIGVTADMTSQEIATLRDNLRSMSSIERTNQSVDNLVQGFQVLVAAGMDAQTAMASIENIGRAATASGTDIKDMAKTALVLINTLDIKPEGLAMELNRLTAAGNAGSFEMESMARFFPVLGAAAKEAGLTGSEAVSTLAASLQMAIKGAGEPGEAANNLKNFFSKLASTETINNFKKANVDIIKVFANALKAGKNPVEVILQKIDSMLGSDVAQRKRRMSALFGDEQVKDFIRPMLSNMKDYTAMKAMLMDDAKVSGAVNEGFARMLKTFNEKATGATNATRNLGEAIGKSWLEPLGKVMDVATPAITWLSDVADKSPTAAFAASALGTAVMVLPGIFRAASLAATIFGGTVTIMGRAVAVTPIGALVKALAVGAGVVYDHWQPIKTFFLGIWDGVAAKWNAFADYVSQIWTRISEPVNKAMAFLGTSGQGGFGGSSGRAASGSFGAAAAGAGNSGTGKIDVSVRIDNLPRGSDTNVISSGSAVGDVDMYTGLQMAYP